jgi:phospholipid/cholesterol/gamma-HCH transport system substrate-binding protein
MSASQHNRPCNLSIKIFRYLSTQTLKITKEFKIGLFSVVVIFLFIWGLNYLKGRDLFSRQIVFYAIYDNVAGLVESNSISLSGVKIGQVNSIRFVSDGSGRILVEGIISNGIDIPSNSIAQLTGASLMGNREIIIILGDSSIMLSDNDTLQSGLQISFQEEVSQMVMPIKQRAEDLFVQVDSVLDVFQSIFTLQTRTNIISSFESIQNTLQNLESTTEKLDQTIEEEASRISNIISNAESITTNLRNNNELINNMMTNLSNISDSIAAGNITQTLANAEKSIENFNHIMEKINRGEGTIGLLVNDDDLYNNLEGSSRQLELLLEEVRNNPRGFISFSIFGR